MPLDWCCYDAIKNRDLMTTSNLEAWHRQLKSSFGVNPAFNRFMLNLIKQQDRVTQKLRDIRGNGPPPRRPRSADKEFKEQLREQASKQYGKSGYKEHLDALATLIMKRSK